MIDATRAGARLLALMGVACGAVSCQTAPPQTTAPSRQVTAADFASEGAPGRPPAQRERVERTPIQADSRDDVVVIVGSPERPASAPSPAPPTARPAVAPANERLAVDQLVGQINGRPVFANEFFASMDARLRQEATRLSNREWFAMAKKDIEAELWNRLRDQLLLAEFETTLTPEQKMGLFAFVESIRSDLISRNFGSEAVANERLQQTEQTDLDSKVADISKRVLIEEQIRRQIRSRVQVSFWDVRLYYEQNLAQFMPPPVAKFVIIQAPTSDEECIARIESALAAGEDFAAIAARESAWRPDAGNGHEVTIASRDYATQRYFGPEPLNNAALALTPGEWTGRIDIGRDCWWIKLAEIHQPEGRTLYEAQSEIEERLRAQREREEEVRYFTQLFERGSFSDVKEMSARLLQFAAERYLIQDRMVAQQQQQQQAPAPAPSDSAPATEETDEAPSEP